MTFLLPQLMQLCQNKDALPLQDQLALDGLQVGVIRVYSSQVVLVNVEMRTAESMTHSVAAVQVQTALTPGRPVTRTSLT